MPLLVIGMHKYLNDYIFSSLENFKLLLSNKNFSQSNYSLKTSHSYLRKVEITHHIVNELKQK